MDYLWTDAVGLALTIAADDDETPFEVLCNQIWEEMIAANEEHRLVRE